MACGEKGDLHKLADKLGVELSRKTSGGQKSVAAIYDYKDKDSKLIFQVVRYRPKTFHQRRPDGRGGWIYNLEGTNPVIYRLPELLSAPADEPVFIAEGEKGANALIEHGLTATCSPMGDGKWRDEYVPPFSNRNVVILPDNDDHGEQHAEQVARSLSGIARSVRIIHLPGIKEKEDVFDWFAKGNTPAQLIELARERSSWTPPDQIELSALLDEISLFISRYVVLSDHQLQIIVLWVIHTHVIKQADTTPYLNIYSAEKRSGKTRLLETLEVLVARPWFTGRVTTAVLARKIDAECPTLLLDESDAAFNSEKEYSEALRGILNSGYRRGGKSSVCVGKGIDIGYKDLSTFCPKAIAGIGKLPGTIADRSIPILLKRRMPDEQVERFRPQKIRQEIEQIRASLDRCPSISFENIDLESPQELDDRAADCLEPLLAIAKAAGHDWSDKARQAAISLMAGEMRQDDSLGMQLLSDIREIARDKVDQISSAELISALNGLEESLWHDFNGSPLTARKLAKLLKPYEIKSQSIRINGCTPKGYKIPDFEDAWNRYLSNTELLSATSATPSFEPIVNNTSELSATFGLFKPFVADNLQSYAKRNVADKIRK